jgi:hypothetical protein
MSEYASLNARQMAEIEHFLQSRTLVTERGRELRCAIANFWKIVIALRRTVEALPPPAERHPIICNCLILMSDLQYYIGHYGGLWHWEVRAERGEQLGHGATLPRAAATAEAMIYATPGEDGRD